MQDPTPFNPLPEENVSPEPPSADTPAEIDLTPAPAQSPVSTPLRLARLILPLILAAAIGLGAGYWLWGHPQKVPGVGNMGGQTVAADLASLLPSSDPAIGPANAPITIVEFSDYECPFCRQWQATVYNGLQKAYPNRIRFVYRDFPLMNIHPDAEPAAEAADCAGDQGKYWEYHDELLAANTLGQQTYLAIAGKLGLDTTRFTNCIQSHQFRAEVLGDLKDGITLGINGTPTFFINGNRLEGAQPLADFQNLIDQVINQKVAPGP